MLGEIRTDYWHNFVPIYVWFIETAALIITDHKSLKLKKNLGLTYLVRQGYDGLKVDIILLLFVVLVLRVGALHALIVLPDYLTRVKKYLGEKKGA